MVYIVDLPAERGRVHGHAWAPAAARCTNEPARAPPWLPAARQIPLGPLGTAPPLVDLALAVSEFAGARRGANGGPKGSEPIFCIFHRSIGAAVLVVGFLSTLVVDLDW